MDPEPDLVLLEHIRERIARIEEYTGGEHSRFYDPRLVQDVVSRNLQSIAGPRPQPFGKRGRAQMSFNVPKNLSADSVARLWCSDFGNMLRRLVESACPSNTAARTRRGRSYPSPRRIARTPRHVPERCLDPAPC